MEVWVIFLFLVSKQQSEHLVMVVGWVTAHWVLLILACRKQLHILGCCCSQSVLLVMAVGLVLLMLVSRQQWNILGCCFRQTVLLVMAVRLVLLMLVSRQQWNIPGIYQGVSLVSYYS